MSEINKVRIVALALGIVSGLVSVAIWNEPAYEVQDTGLLILSMMCFGIFILTFYHDEYDNE